MFIEARAGIQEVFLGSFGGLLDMVASIEMVARVQIFGEFLGYDQVEKPLQNGQLSHGKNNQMTKRRKISQFLSPKFGL